MNSQPAAFWLVFYPPRIGRVAEVKNMSRRNHCCFSTLSAGRSVSVCSIRISPTSSIRLAISQDQGSASIFGLVASKIHFFFFFLKQGNRRARTGSPLQSGGSPKTRALFGAALSISPSCPKLSSALGVLCGYSGAAGKASWPVWERQG